jgi:hypothetical protein
MQNARSANPIEQPLFLWGQRLIFTDHEHLEFFAGGRRIRISTTHSGQIQSILGSKKITYCIIYCFSIVFLVFTEKLQQVEILI